MPDNKKIDSNVPGPFQKYLFSGACYVQIGNCYKTIKTLKLENKEIDQNDALRESLCSIWNGFLTQQNGAVSENFTEKIKNSKSNESKFDQLNREIHSAGVEVAREFLKSINQIDTDDLDLKQFFVHWTSVCDKAYTQLIQSESYATAMGEAFNMILRSLPFDEPKPEKLDREV